jgi:hypothetical protein
MVQGGGGGGGTGRCYERCRVEWSGQGRKWRRVSRGMFVGHVGMAHGNRIKMRAGSEGHGEERSEVVEPVSGKV